MCGKGTHSFWTISLIFLTYLIQTHNFFRECFSLSLRFLYTSYKQEWEAEVRFASEPMCRMSAPSMSGKAMSHLEHHSLRHRFMKHADALLLMIGWVILYELVLALHQNKEIPTPFWWGHTINRLHFIFSWIPYFNTLTHNSFEAYEKF